MNDVRLCRFQPVRGGPMCVLNSHPDFPDGHGFVVRMSDWLPREAIRRASILEWKNIGVERMSRLLDGDWDALPELVSRRIQSRIIREAQQE